MKRIGKISLFTAIILTGILMISAWQNKPENERIKAGIATANITPDKPVRMSGYAARKDPFKGVHDELFASSVVFEKNGTKTCIITSDVIGYSHEFTDATRQVIEKETGIPEGNIMISAAHNHGGPRTRAYGEEPTENEAEYVSELQDKLVDITRRAYKNLEPVRIGVGKGSCKMNVNRRALHAEGGVWLGRNPDGVCDTEVGVVRIDNMNGETVGLLVNWPCHATTGGQDNYMITGDWPGATARILEKEYPEAIVMISAGASGDINPIYGPNNSFNDINAIGQELAKEVIKINENITPFEFNDLEIKSDIIIAEGKKPSDSRMPNVSLEEAPDVEIRVSALKLGPVLLAGISGELMNEIGLDIKEDSPYKNTFIYTHCNGNSGYLCTDVAYTEGGYEPMVSRTMPGTADKIKEKMLVMINEL